jgi:glycosyltransferase involved in cell wall biosynthesis
LHYALVRKKIKKAIKTYPQSDAFVSLTFSFSAVGLTKKPVVLFCDFTYEYWYKNLTNSKPALFEKLSMIRETQQINNSDLVISLFPGVAQYMQKRYSNSNIFYLGNVINLEYENAFEQIAEIKQNSYNLLFIGNQKYISGALALIDAYKIVKNKDRRYSLHIIGLNEDDLPDLPQDVYCYGYLDKSIDCQRAQYQQLIEKSMVYVNTTPLWAAFSSSIEAMYLHTPVIVTDYDEFTNTFGNKIEFGEYCNKNTGAEIAKHIESICQSAQYLQMCRNAHNAVKEFSWNNYIDKFINKIQCTNNAK